jgi:hypothetical protein
MCLPFWFLHVLCLLSLFWSMTTSEENNSNPTQEQCFNTKFNTRQEI